MIKKTMLPLMELDENKGFFFFKNHIFVFTTSTYALNIEYYILCFLSNMAATQPQCPSPLPAECRNSLWW